jgi:hypothetical protein
LVRSGAGIDKGVGVGADGCLSEVDGKGCLAVVNRDGGFPVGGLEGIAFGPGGYPVGLAAEAEAGAGAAPDVCDHLSVLDTRALEERDVALLCVLWHDVALSSPGAQSYVAVAVLVHEEYLGAGHAAADAETSPGVVGGGAELEVHVARARAGGGLWHAPLEADIFVIAGAERGGGRCPGRDCLRSEDVRPSKKKEKGGRYGTDLQNAAMPSAAFMVKRKSMGIKYQKRQAVPVVLRFGTSCRPFSL